MVEIKHIYWHEDSIIVVCITAFTCECGNTDQVMYTLVVRMGGQQDTGS
jgi:hypothetical protein